MIRGAITSYIDVAQLVLYAFFAFFTCLIFYLRGEDRREGYPLETEAMGRAKDRGFLLIPKTKTFMRASGEKVTVPNFRRDERTLNARKVEVWPGSPIEPTGDPMLAGVGPGSYAERADHPEKTYHGDDLLAPLRVATNYAVAAEDICPIGFEVVGADGAHAGTIKDLWVDRSEIVLRYYEVALAGGGASVMLPVTFSKVMFAARKVAVQAILGAQFAAVPPLRNPDQITLLEEEKIVAYFGAGTLYATAERSEPLL